jgi:uncharacterized protein (DUF952 family)
VAFIENADRERPLSREAGEGQGGGKAAMTLIYKIISTPEWRAAEANGVFHGAAIDLADGYIHFSTAEQAAETAAKHFAGQSDLLLVAIDAACLGEALKWEFSRGGALFPHLYAPLSLDAVARVAPLPLIDGRHDFTGLL